MPRMMNRSTQQTPMESRGFDRPQRSDRMPPEETELSDEQIEIVSSVLVEYDAENLSEEDVSAIQIAIQTAIEAGEIEPGRALAEAVREQGFNPKTLFPGGGGHPHRAAAEMVEEGGATSEIDSYLSGDAEVDDSEEFNIEVNFLGEWSSELVESVTQAADFLSALIQNNTSLDSSADLTIDIALLDIDGENGVLGSSTVTDTWGDSYTPSESLIEFDIADANSYYEQGLWDDIVLHEMVHSLGFGTVWQNEGVVEVSTDESGEVVVEYTGESASALEPTDADTPIVETDGGAGTAYGHWDEETYGNELMTGTIDESNYISEMTFGALEDLGYEIDYTIDVSDYLGVGTSASLTAATGTVVIEGSAEIAVQSGELLMVADVLDLTDTNEWLPEELQRGGSENHFRGEGAERLSPRDLGPVRFDGIDLFMPPQAQFFE